MGLGLGAVHAGHAARPPGWLTACSRQSAASRAQRGFHFPRQSGQHCAATAGAGPWAVDRGPSRRQPSTGTATLRAGGGSVKAWSGARQRERAADGAGWRHARGAARRRARGRGSNGRAGGARTAAAFWSVGHEYISAVTHIMQTRVAVGRSWPAWLGAVGPRQVKGRVLVGPWSRTTIVGARLGQPRRRSGAAAAAIPVKKSPRGSIIQTRLSTGRRRSDGMARRV